MNKRNRLTTWILVGLALGIAAGYIAHTNLADPKGFADTMSLVTTLFLRLIKMIIAPLVFSTLVVGIAKMGDAAEVGRIGIKALGWFIIASLLSLTLGLILVNLFRPGDAMALSGTLPAAGASSGITASGLTLKDFITHLVPTSIFDGMARNEILQIVIFSIFFGTGAAAIGDRAAPMIAAIDGAAHVMLKVTGYVMNFAPFAVFAAVAGVVATSGVGVLGTYGKFMGEFYLGIALLWCILIAIGMLFVGPRLFKLLGLLREPTILAFTCASSEAAYPKTLEGLERFGVKNRLAAFVLPIGYSFNLDGSMMYCTFASVFIAQAYGIELALSTQMTMMLVLMLTSKGMAGVPRASLVVIAATLNQFHIPEAGLLLLLGIDHFLDMGRSATNVIGNGIATAVVAKWEGDLTDPALADKDIATAPLR
ncbi:dicarboxylate/amino acid:cation symporter [Massilia sp. GER05]|jgi:Na+/H+-dicarboxylate symporter|uniref:Cation:dicarboxylase symporter family transporter n=1 Tax=Massilia cellulosiltytica TaxID=2683234 RepID=A0A7X3KAT7_9BURK|nr:MULTISPECIES: dicarboxylate/amino acid:cation symporter [Telluria group]KQZ46116.1 C4-dicarboxylate ABC transporter [Massilia sp. Root1485]MVW64383.1 cation:dicarboxylase symporter family transporter [Telluria cellulosilytica]